MPSWLRPGGLEIEILKIDERPLEPEITVRVKATDEVKTVSLGKISSSEGDLTVYREAKEIIRQDASESSE